MVAVNTFAKGNNCPACPFESDEERLQQLIPVLTRVSIIQRRLTNLQQTQLQEQEEMSDTKSKSETYIESVTDSHDYEFPSDNEDNPPPIYDEDISGHPNNQV